MKPHLIVLLLLVVLSTAGRAQMVRGWGIEGGGSGGYQLLSITSATHVPSIPYVIRWGFTAGAFVEFLNMPVLSLVLETAYAQRGRTVTAEEVAASQIQAPGLSTGPPGGIPRLDYVHVAMLVKMRTWKIGFVPYALIGPRFDFLTGRAQDPSHLLANFKRSDVGVTMGGGIEIVTHRKPLVSLEGRWSPSISRALTTPSLTIRNQSVDLLFLLWL